MSSDQAEQTGTSLTELHDLRRAPRRTRRRAARGSRAEEADTLGSEAQTRAEAIAGQISQAAGELDIKLEN